jgi:hypothetical protein
MGLECLSWLEVYALVHVPSGFAPYWDTSEALARDQTDAQKGGD